MINNDELIRDFIEQIVRYQNNSICTMDLSELDQRAFPEVSIAIVGVVACNG